MERTTGAEMVSENISFLLLISGASYKKQTDLLLESTDQEISSLMNASREQNRAQATEV